MFYCQQPLSSAGTVGDFHTCRLLFNSRKDLYDGTCDPDQGQFSSAITAWQRQSQVVGSYAKKNRVYIGSWSSAETDHQASRWLSGNARAQCILHCAASEIMHCADSLMSGRSDSRTSMFRTRRGPNHTASTRSHNVFKSIYNRSGVRRTAATHDTSALFVLLEPACYMCNV